MPVGIPRAIGHHFGSSYGAGDKLASTNITAHSERRGQSWMVLGGPSACRPRILEELARLMIIPFFFLYRIICYESIPFGTESNISRAEKSGGAASNWGKGHANLCPGQQTTRRPGRTDHSAIIKWKGTQKAYDDLDDASGAGLSRIS